MKKDVYYKNDKIVIKMECVTKMSRNNRKKGRVKRIVLISFCIILPILVVGGAWFYIKSLAYSVCRIEAGIEITPSDFIKNGDLNAVFTEDSPTFSTSEPGEYQVRIKSGYFTHRCTLIVEDTVAPVAEAVTVKTETGKSCEADSFVTNISDATEVTVSFVDEPDFFKNGVQTVQVCLSDRGNNVLLLETELYVMPVRPDVTVEAGQEPPKLADFVIAGEKASFATDMEEISFNTVGEHKIGIEVDGVLYESTLRIKDTVPPKAVVRDVAGYEMVPRYAAEFVETVEDATLVTAEFAKEPDLSYIGTQELSVVLTDEGGNQVIEQVQLTLQEDTEPPVMKGVEDLLVFIGDSVSYRKKVTLTDNSGAEPELEVDSSTVNLNEAGVYPVTYTARDAAGNVTSRTINLTVMAREYSEETVNALADKVLAKIIKPEMTLLEKVQAIYDYNMGHIGYINHSQHDDWVKAAYEGLADRQGDCYVYACTAKLLLTRAGITNMDIEKIPAKTRHYWNLVDIGDGWYHFDTTPRKDHPTIFMWDDVQMMEYSESHNKSHNYDHSLYPLVNGAVTE